MLISKAMNYVYILIIKMGMKWKGSRLEYIDGTSNGGNPSIRRYESTTESDSIVVGSPALRQSGGSYYSIY